jgi:hypothetical protein
VKSALGKNHAFAPERKIYGHPPHNQTIHIRDILPDQRKAVVVPRLTKTHEEKTFMRKPVTCKIRDPRGAGKIKPLRQDNDFRPPQAGEMKKQKMQGEKKKTERKQAPSHKMDPLGFQLA